MDNCIFCKIVRKEIPNYTVYEDEHFLAFLDINPESVGHTQIIPKKHYRWVWDVPSSAEASAGEPNIGQYFEVAKKVALAQKKAFNTEMILSKIYGEEIPHAHIWIYPDPTIKGDKKDFEGNLEKIKRSLI